MEDNGRRRVDPADAIGALRQQALTVSAAGLGLASSALASGCFGVLMETGYPGAVATLVAFVDGSTSLYFSTGGGIIGGGAHAAVRAAGVVFIGQADANRAQFAGTTETPLPGVGRVTFYVRTLTGTLTAEADQQELGHGRHALSPVFHAGQAVIAALRESTPRAD